MINGSIKKNKNYTDNLYDEEIIFHEKQDGYESNFKSKSKPKKNKLKQTASFNNDTKCIKVSKKTGIKKSNFTRQ